MTRRPANLTPVDRALAELDQRLTATAQQTRQLEDPGRVRAKTPVGLGAQIRDWLRPPPRRLAPVPRKDLFDAPADPMKDLEAAPTQFLGTEPDLFAAAREKQKLAQYLQAGTPPVHRPLRHVQRRQRERFYLGLGLGVVALVLLWIVVR
jgi:hypothetical protein